MQLWKPQQTIQNGKYAIETIVGSGGFGITYKAKDQKSGRWVAIKTLNHMEQSKPDFRQRQQKFVNEALRLARCSHPYVVSIYELIEEDGLWGMVMEYVEGEDLATYLDNKGVFSEVEALAVVEKIGDALAFIHQNGFLHRDIKPNNIILRQDTKLPVLIDFGLAREFSLGKIQTMTNHRSEHFAPIEQYEIRGESGAYTDIYALSATLYVLLTQQLPFPANFRNSGIDLIEPKHHNPNISDRTNRAIIKGMELLPQRRPRAVKQWLDLLKQSPLQRFKFEVVTVNAKGDIIDRQEREAEYFRENLGGGVTLDMVSIPGGTFVTGSSEANEDGRDKPRQVSVPPFFMGKFAVTQAQWQAVAKLPKIDRDLQLDPAMFEGANKPVERVSWDDAMEFCTRLSRHSGKKYRLPSESEWDYACSGGTTAPFQFGAENTANLANYNGTFTYASEQEGNNLKQATDIGNFPPNAFGLYDMHSNVRERYADPWYDKYNNADNDRSIWGEEDDSTFYCLKSATWYVNPYDCGSALRFNSSRVFFGYVTGFRLVFVPSKSV